MLIILLGTMKLSKHLRESESSWQKPTLLPYGWWHFPPDSVGRGLLSLPVVFSLGYMGKWPRQILKTAYQVAPYMAQFHAARVLC